MNDCQNPISVVAICVATYKRNEWLRTLLMSLRAIEIPESVRVQLRIVDNDANGGAESVVSKFRSESHPFEQISYGIEPTRNIALARNTGLEMGPADAVVFVDDDEYVANDWFVRLWATFKKTDSDAVFGPVFGVCPKHSPRWMSEGGFFNKEVPVSGTKVDWTQTRTSNTLVRGSWFYGERSHRFDEALGRSGGSDSALFALLEKQGARFVSCAEAVVHEEVPAERATLAWLFKRYYRNGLIYERVSSTKGSFFQTHARIAKRVFSILYYAGTGSVLMFAGKFEQLVRAWLQLALTWGGIVARFFPFFARSHDAYGSNQGSLKVAFLTNIVSPYRKPVFESLSQTENWHLRIFTNASSEYDRNWNIDGGELDIKQSASISLKRKVNSLVPTPFTQVVTLHFPYGLIFDLFRFNPQVVVSHELGLRTLVALIYTKMTKKSLVIWAYQSKVSATQGRWRNALRKMLLSKATKVVGMGTQARHVLMEWGVPAEKIVDAPNAADHGTLARVIADNSTPKKVQQLQNRWAKNRKLAIVVGRLIPLKGIDSLIEIWSKLPEEVRSEWKLVFIGDGPLSSLVEDSNDPSIELAGYVQDSEMALWYQAADLHIFPSRGDVWGLTVNEASFCGTPSLCSVHAGCFDDLIDCGRNGLSIDFLDPIDAYLSLSNALCREDLSSLGNQAKMDVSRFTPQRLAHSFKEAVIAS